MDHDGRYGVGIRGAGTGCQAARRRHTREPETQVGRYLFPFEGKRRNARKGVGRGREKAGTPIGGVRSL